MEKANIPQECPQCGKKIILFSGINREGKPYKFWGCEDRTSCRYIFKMPSRQDKYHQEIMEALREIWKKLDTIEEKVDKKLNNNSDLNEL